MHVCLDHSERNVLGSFGKECPWIHWHLPCLDRLAWWSLLSTCLVKIKSLQIYDRSIPYMIWLYTSIIILCSQDVALVDDYNTSTSTLSYVVHHPDAKHASALSWWDVGSIVSHVNCQLYPIVLQFRGLLFSSHCWSPLAEGAGGRDLYSWRVSHGRSHAQEGRTDVQ